MLFWTVETNGECKRIFVFRHVGQWQREQLGEVTHKRELKGGHIDVTKSVTNNVRKRACSTRTFNSVKQTYLGEELN